jgi:hypothetical protein
MEFEFSQRIFEKSSYIKFHENISSEYRIVSMWTDTTNLLDALRNSANAPIIKKKTF